MLARVGKVHPKMLITPGNSRSLHGFAIREESLSGLSSDHSAQRRRTCSFAVSLHQTSSTSRPWQLAQSSSKIPFPILGSPAGTTTSGSLIPPFFLGGIRIK